MNEKVMFCINYVAERVLFILAIVLAVVVYLAITGYGTFKLFNFFGHPILGVIFGIVCPIAVAHAIGWILDVVDEAMDKYENEKEKKQA